MSADIFDQFWAVVLMPRGRWEVLWSPGQPTQWLERSPYVPGFFSYSPATPDLHPEDVGTVADLAAQFHDRYGQDLWCTKCQLLADQHLVAPDPHGVPTLYCVQLPTAEAAMVGGGAGDKKHVLDGCGSGARVATAAQIRDRRWCRRCTG